MPSHSVSSSGPGIANTTLAVDSIASGGIEGIAHRRPSIEVAAWCLFYVVIFTLIQTLSHAAGDLVNDTLEAIAWSQHPALGYSKHPPFWAWIAFGWFKVFPFADWSAYLLASVNGAIGLACTWSIARRFLNVERATGAMLGLMLSATYLCLAMRINANTILISLWPATTLAGLRGIERNRLGDGIVAGLLVAACLLSKYFSVVFLLPLLVTAYFLTGSAKIYRSRSALACYAVVVLAVIPHLIWLQHNDYLPFRYANFATQRIWQASLKESAFFIVTTAGFVAIGTFAYLLSAGTSLLRLPAVLASGFTGKRGAIAILVFGPQLVTIALGLAWSSSVRPIYAIPMLFANPIWIAMAREVHFTARSLRRMRRVVLAIFLVCLTGAPIMTVVFVRNHVRLSVQPKDEILKLVTDEWHRRFRQPLRIVSGDEDYAIGAPFYSPDNPDYLIGFDRRVLDDFAMPMAHGPADFDLRLSPWLTMGAIKDRGMAIICSEEHWSQPTGCDRLAVQWLGADTTPIEVSSTEDSIFSGGQIFKFHVYFLPPG